MPLKVRPKMQKAETNHSLILKSHLLTNLCSFPFVCNVFHSMVEQYNSHFEAQNKNRLRNKEPAIRWLSWPFSLQPTRTVPNWSVSCVLAVAVISIKVRNQGQPTKCEVYLEVPRLCAGRVSAESNRYLSGFCKFWFLAHNPGGM